MRILSTLLLLLLLVLLSPQTANASTISSQEATEVRLINNYRTARGLEPLRIDRRLSSASNWMALDMARNRYFSHTDSLGRSPFQRLHHFGYPSNTYRGENLAAGNAGPGETLRQWLNSRPHRINMLNRNYRAIGIARVYVPGSSYKYYWVTKFGSRWISAPK